MIVNVTTNLKMPYIKLAVLPRVFHGTQKIKYLYSTPE